MASSQGHTMFVVVAVIHNNKLLPIITLGITHFVKSHKDYQKIGS
jgi:hypothetical protein